MPENNKGAASTSTDAEPASSSKMTDVAPPFEDLTPCTLAPEARFVSSWIRLPTRRLRDARLSTPSPRSMTPSRSACATCLATLQLRSGKCHSQSSRIIGVNPKAMHHVLSCNWFRRVASHRATWRTAALTALIQRLLPRMTGPNAGVLQNDKSHETDWQKLLPSVVVRLEFKALRTQRARTS